MSKLEEIQKMTEDLDPTEKEKLAVWMLESIEGNLENEEEVRKAWDLEIQNRLKKIESGEAEFSPAEEVMNRFRKQFNLDR